MDNRSYQMPTSLPAEYSVLYRLPIKTILKYILFHKPPLYFFPGRLGVPSIPDVELLSCVVNVVGLAFCYALLFAAVDTSFWSVCKSEI